MQPLREASVPHTRWLEGMSVKSGAQERYRGADELAGPPGPLEEIVRSY